MIEIPINKHMIEYGEGVLKHKNLGTRRAGFNGTPAQQLTGILGELAVYEIMNWSYPSYEDFHQDDIIIGEKKIDVKTRGSKYDMKPDWAHNIVMYQLPKLSPYIIFCNHNRVKEHIQVCGYLTKDEIEKLLVKTDKGGVKKRDDGTWFRTGAPHGEVYQKQLHDISVATDLENLD